MPDHPANANERTDEQLVTDFMDGDDGAFRTLIQRYHADLLRFLTRLTGDQALAEDLFQDTFLQVHQSAASFDTSRTFRPWLFTIAANKARDELRKRSRRRTLELSAPVGGSESDGATFVDLMQIDIPSPEEITDTAERDQMVQRALNALSPTLREILLLAYFQRLSYQQIADDLGIPLGTVKSRLHAAVAAFARRWHAVNRDPRETPASDDTT
ncbi:MAG: RNA polymerase sigma factor [Phycisphaerales bacterium JB040]